MKRRVRETKRPLIIYATFIVLLQLLVLAVRGYSYEIDASDVVTNVVDGDTFDTGSGDTTRLADIDAPEYGYPGYNESTAYLTALIDDKTVYLDIDDINRIDPYGRLVCVAYIDHNSTHLENVNEAMLETEHAEIWNFTNNEFNPYEWTRYVPITPVPEFPPQITLPILMATTLLTIVIARKMSPKNTKMKSAKFAKFNYEYTHRAYQKN